jgi:hypothetical protein
MSEKIRTEGLSAELAHLKSLCSGDEIQVRDLVEVMNARGHAVLTLFFGIPFLLPMPLPGLSVPFGLIILVAGVAMSMGRHPWLPRWLLNRRVKGQILLKVFSMGERISRRLERIVKPRGVSFSKQVVVRVANGIVIALCGLILALPLPPGTNFPPAAVIVCLSIAILEADIILISVAYVGLIINFLLFKELLALGIKGVQSFMGWA